MLCPPKVHCLVYKSPLIIAIWSSLKKLHNLAFLFLKVHFNVFLSFTHRSPSGFVGFVFPSECLMYF